MQARVSLIFGGIAAIGGFVITSDPDTAAQNLCKWVVKFKRVCPEAVSKLDIPETMPYWLFAIAIILIGWAIWPFVKVIFSTKQDYSTQETKAATLLTLSNPSNVQLKTQARAHAQRMRVFDANFQESEDRISAEDRAQEITQYNPFKSATLTEDEKEVKRADLHKNWVAKSQNSEVRQAARRKEYGIQFRPDALALREEINRRLGIFEDQDKKDFRSKALDHPWPRGTTSITQIADYLDEIARKLP